MFAEIDKVLPALAHLPKALGEEQDSQEQEAYARRLRLFWQETEASEEPAVVETRRKSNVQYVVAIDHALTAMHGVGLSAFEPRDPAVGPLDEHVRRYFVPLTDLMPTEASPGKYHETERRSCLENTSTGARRLELPRGQGNLLRTLHVTIDEGSIGFPALLWLMNGVKLRMSFWPDPCHRISNNLAWAQDVSGLAVIRQETMVCMKLPTGPWGNHAFWQQIRGSREELHNRGDGAQNQFFFDAGKPYCPGYGPLFAGR